MSTPAQRVEAGLVLVREMVEGMKPALGTADFQFQAAIECLCAMVEDQAAELAALRARVEALESRHG